MRGSAENLPKRYVSWLLADLRAVLVERDGQARCDFYLFDCQYGARRGTRQHYPGTTSASGFLKSRRSEGSAVRSKLPGACERCEFFVRLIRQESNFDPYSVSHKGAQGIEQFMRDTARWRGLADPFVPQKELHE